MRNNEIGGTRPRLEREARRVRAFDTSRTASPRVEDIARPGRTRLTRLTLLSAVALNMAARETRVFLRGAGETPTSGRTW